MTRPILYISGPYSPGNGRTVARAQDAEEEGYGETDPGQVPVQEPAPDRAKPNGIASYGLSAPNVEIIGNGEQNEALQADTEPVIPDAEIDAAEPWAPGGDGSDSLTPIVKILEHYGAKWPPGFFDQPIAAVRVGLKKAARDGLGKSDETVVCMITGKGLKDVASARKVAGDPVPVVLRSSQGAEGRVWP